MVIDYTISIGNLIEIVSIIGGGLMVLITMRGDVNNMKEEIAAIQREIKTIGDVLITQAGQDQRILHLEESVRELRHGQGFIRGKFNRSVDGEY